MEPKTIHMIESLFQEKALLYADLVECFKKERDHLAAMEFEPLWIVSDEKSRLCLKIRELRSKIASTLDLDSDGDYDVNRILEAVPPQQQGPVRNILLRIMSLKKEVEMMRQFNKDFIDDSLLFLDELISILAGEGERETIYNGRCRLCRTEALASMNREV